MKLAKKLLAAGGDCRQTFAVEYLVSRLKKVYTVGAKNAVGAVRLASADELDERVDALLLPAVPMEDIEHVSAPFYEKRLPIKELAAKIKRGGTVFSGDLPRETEYELLSSGFVVENYMRDEKTVLLNTVPTAEGALGIAIGETPRTVRGSAAAVIGYGRVGESCAELFRSVGASVTVFERREDKRTRAKLRGSAAASIDSVGNYRGDIIINTVPARILTEEVLCGLPKSTLVIDLASKPGGVDMRAAAALGVNVIWALALPGKTAPATAGEIIGEFVASRLKGGDR